MYIGNVPADKYQTLQKQSFTTSATDTYTLSYAVTNPQDLALFVNNVRQNPNDAYTVSGTTLTLSSAITSSDTMYAVFLGRAVETVAPALSSVTNDMLAGSIANSKLANSSITLNGSAVSLGGSASVANTPAFYGQLASDQVVSRNTLTKLTGFTANEIDTDSAFDGTTFTVPSGKAGKYYIYAGLFANFDDCGDDGEVAQLNIFKNGSSFKEGKYDATFNNGIKFFSISFGVMIDLSVGDTIEAYTLLRDASANTGMKANDNQTFLGGYKLIGA
jgi:hypothetical protein